MAIFNALLNLRELKELYSGKPVCVCPLYKGVINAPKTFEATGNPIVLPEYKSLVKLKTTFSPKQAGTGNPSPENVRPISGYDSVTVTRCGKNLFGCESIEGVIDAGKDQLIVGPLGEYPTFITRIKPGETYTASRTTTGIIRLGVSPEKPYLGMTFSNAFSITSNKLSITAGENDKWLACNVPHYQDEEVQLEPGSTPTPYEPYQGNAYVIALPETVYGGSVDAVTGVGSKTWGFISSYNGEALPGEWISDRDVYSSGTTPTTGAQVAYKLATPEPFKVSQVSIPSLRGENYFFTNGENMDIIYKKESFWSDEA